MAEAAYRNLIQKAEKSNKLPEGWQVLGIEQDVALSIYREEKGAGFKTFQEEIYGGANESYNKKGQRIDAEGFVIEEADIEQNEKDAEWGVDEDETASTSGAFECGNCGYTLFVAKGREAKFFGAGFKCPQCGAEKDQFTTLDPDDIE
jgi:rubrerythrin